MVTDGKAEAEKRDGYCLQMPGFGPAGEGLQVAF